MNKRELATRIQACGKLIDSQQDRNMNLTSQLVPAVAVGIQASALHDQLSNGITKPIELCNHQNELIEQYFKAND